MLVIEQMIDEIARTLALDPLVVRRRNYYGAAPRNVTHYGQYVEDNILDTAHRPARGDAAAIARVASEIAHWNAANTIDQARPRDDAGEVRHLVQRDRVQPGRRARPRLYRRHACCSITAAPRWGRASTRRSHRSSRTNSACRSRAYARARPTRARCRTRPRPRRRAAPTSTARLRRPLRRRCAQRLVEHACKVYGVAAEQVRFANGEVEHRRASACRSRISCSRAYQARVSLSATGFYATPKMHWDRSRLNGRPFFYFAYGVAVSEVAVDTLTGETQLLARRHPARRRHVAQSRDRSRPDRGRFPAGRRLAHERGALVEREGRTARRTRRRRTRFRVCATGRCMRTCASSSTSRIAKTRSIVRRPSASRR